MKLKQFVSPVASACLLTFCLAGAPSSQPSTKPTSRPTSSAPPTMWEALATRIPADLRPNGKEWSDQGLKAVGKWVSAQLPPGSVLVFETDKAGFEGPDRDTPFAESAELFRGGIHWRIWATCDLDERSEKALKDHPEHMHYRLSGVIGTIERVEVSADGDPKRKPSIYFKMKLVGVSISAR